MACLAEPTEVDAAAVRVENDRVSFFVHHRTLENFLEFALHFDLASFERSKGNEKG